MRLLIDETPCDAPATTVQAEQGRSLCYFWWYVLNIKFVPVAHNDHCPDGVSQLADIARPVVA